MKVQKTVVATLIWAAAHIAFAYNGGYENSLDYKTNPGVGYGNYELTATPTLSSTVEANAYAQCKKLKSVNLSGVTSIGNAAFAYSALETVTIPGSLKSMGYIAFGGCTNLTSVTIWSYGWYEANTEPFRDCTKLVTATVGGGVPSWPFTTVFPNIRTVRCPKANVAAWKSAYPSLTVQDKDAAYSIQFIKNDGAGTLTTKKFAYGVNTKLPTLSELGWPRNGMSFKGWATSAARAAAGTIWKTDGAVVASPTPVGTTMDAIAVWALKSGYYGIKYNKNDGSGKWRSAAYQYGVKTALPSCAGGLGWTRTGYTFKGWSFSANGTIWKGDRGIVQSGIPAGTTRSIYAIWEKDVSTYKIRFVKNDGAGTLTNVTFNCGVSTKLPTLSALKWTRNGMTFKGWTTSGVGAFGGTAKYVDGATVTSLAAAGATVDLIAVWELKSGFYGLKYYKNDGTGKWRSAAYKYGVKTTLPSCGVGLGWTRTGYTFMGWSLTSGGTTAWKPDRGVIVTGVPAGKVFNLYAIWKKTAASFVSTPRANIFAASMEWDSAAADRFLSGTVAGVEMGYFNLLVDGDGKTGYVRMTLDDEINSGECEILLVDGKCLIIALGETIYTLEAN